jgi:hypothetical protein
MNKLTTVRAITMNLPLTALLRCLIVHATSSDANGTFARQAKVRDADKSDAR